jgi:hypothetical protein
MLDCLTLVVLLSSRLKELSLIRTTIEPIVYQRTARSSSIEQRIFSPDVLNQKTVVFVILKQLQHFYVLISDSNMYGSLSHEVLL